MRAGGSVFLGGQKPLALEREREKVFGGVGSLSWILGRSCQKQLGKERAALREPGG